MNYRHGTGQTIISDIMKGLVRNGRFDQNSNRVDYGELLSVDVDYELDQAVGLTYSDMEALMEYLFV